MWRLRPRSDNPPAQFKVTAGRKRALTSGRSSDRRASEPFTASDILRLALPTLGALVAEPLFLLADTAIVGHLGARPLAGLGTSAAALSTLVSVCAFLAYGTTSAVARRVGAGDMTGAMRTGVDGMALAGVLGVVLAVVGATATAPIVRALGATPTATGYAVTYLRISSAGLPAMLLVLAGTGLFRGLADTRITLYVAAIGSAFNVALNYVLVYPAGMGIAGSALGTVLAQVGMAAAYLIVALRAARSHAVRPVPRLRGMGSVFRQNVPLLVRTASLRAYLLTGVWVAGSLGTVALAAHTVASMLWGLLAMALDSLAIAAQTLIGRALGAGDRESAAALLNRLTRWGMVYGVGTGLLLLGTAPMLVQLLTSDRDVRADLGGVIMIMALLQPVAGAVFVLDGVLMGAGDLRFLAVAGVISTAVFVAAAVPSAIAPLTFTDLWWAVAVFMVVRLATLLIRTRSPRLLTAYGD